MFPSVDTFKCNAFKDPDNWEKRGDHWTKLDLRGTTKRCTFNNVTTLRLDLDSSSDPILPCLQKFKNVQCLELLYDCEVNDIDPFPTDEEIKALFPKLIALKSDYGSFLTNKIVNLYADKLDTLSFNDDKSIDKYN